MEQFKATFVEESLEGLDTMESVLLELQPGNTDADAIDNIFRAAHSIKGGSATFGFEDIAAFTHVVETLLDQIRNGERPVTQEAIDLFLQSVDCIRDMLAASGGATVADQERIDEVKHGLDRMLDDEAVPAIAQTASVTAEARGDGWQIHFKPYPNMLRTGNDAVRMFRELAELGELEVEADASALPALSDLDPEESYLAWDLTLRGEASRAQVDEIFEWVEGECDLVINSLETGNTVQPEAPVPIASAVPDAEERREGGERRKAATSVESSSIRVSIDKVDDLINMVGELVITQSMLSQLGEDFQMDRVERLKDGLSELERNTRELQESVMRIRMLPISFAFNRFPRMVHDLSAKLGKKIELTMSGEQTDLDKTVMEKIGDPLVHLVRNSIDHGIESPEVRVAAGKPETGNVHLNAYHQGGNIVIEISDDGAGLNREKIFAKAVERGLIDANDELPDERIYELLFEPGFSTADVVSDVSGRGVGMDVVKRNIMALSGSIEVTTEAGQGSTFTIRLPLTLAILDGQLISVGGQIYIVPLVSIVESLLINQKMVNAIAGKAEVYKLREDYLPIVRLYKTFGLSSDQRDIDGGLLVVVEGEGKKVGLLVDDLLGQQQVVIKSLETNYKKVDGLSGATILGDGTVALIVDVAGIIRLSKSDTVSLCNSDGDKQVVAA
jgi:two-component system chemotaxis sensor kinase CheA